MIYNAMEVTKILILIFDRVVRAGVAVQEFQQLPLQFLLAQAAAGVQDRLLRQVYIGALEELAGQVVILLHFPYQHQQR